MGDSRMTLPGRAWTAWRRLSFARKIRLFGFAALLISVVELAIVSFIYERLLGFWQGFLVNLGTDALGVAITVLVLNALQERAQEEQLKEQLIREMGSSVRDVAVRAVEELRTHGWGWEKDESLIKAHLKEANLQEAQLEGANLQEAYLQDADLQKAYLTNANLRGAHLEGADLSEAHLVNADLRGANLGYSHTRWDEEGPEPTRLRRAILRKAQLQGAFLEGASLAGASLEGANLQGVHLEGADLSGASLEDANLQGAHLEHILLNYPRYNRSTKWPDGFDPQAVGAIDTDEEPEYRS